MKTEYCFTYGSDYFNRQSAAFFIFEQAKQRVANEKKKQNEKKRKAGKPLPHNPLSPMPKMKGRAVRNDKGEGTFFHSETEQRAVGS